MKNSDNNFLKFERDGLDFPYYNGQPAGFTVVKAFILTIISAMSVILYIYLLSTPVSPVILSFTILVIPLCSLMIVVRSGWTKLYKKLCFTDIFIIIGTFIVIKISSTLVGYLFIISGVIHQGSGTNPIVNIIQSNSNLNNILLLFNTFVQLCGEEVITIIPFLCIMFICVKKYNMSRKSATILAWIVSAIIFGALHLSTYNWNVIQAVVGIGITRLLLTYPYIKTKNLWVSSFVHILNDWSIFIPVILQNIK